MWSLKCGLWFVNCKSNTALPSVSRPPSWQTCLYQGSADHLPAVHLEKQASVPTMKKGSLCPRSGRSQLWPSERWEGSGVFTFTTEFTLMWKSIVEYSPFLLMCWISCWAFMWGNTAAAVQTVLSTNHFKCHKLLIGEGTECMLPQLCTSHSH